MPKKKVVKKSVLKRKVASPKPAVNQKSNRQSTPTAKKVALKKLAPGKKGTKPKEAVAAKKSLPPSPAVKSHSPVKEDSSPSAEVSLGRPLVTQEEKLYMLFHGDYHARQVFEFLRVETVKELEQYSPQQIIHLLSKPIRTTVDRIRLRLAELKRSLRDDEEFAASHRAGAK